MLERSLNEIADSRGASQSASLSELATVAASVGDVLPSGGPGVLARDTADGVAGWEELPDRGEIVVEGADPTGVADSSDAFAAARDAVMATAVDAGGGHYALQAKLVIPAGTFRIDDPGSLLDAGMLTGTEKIVGYVIEGAGRVATTIEFGAASGALLVNDDQVLELQIRDLSVEGDSASVVFIDSTSQGNAAQHAYIENVSASGSWDDLVVLQGDDDANNNSEWTFQKCNFNGTYAGAVFSVGPQAHVEQDQFVNHDFLSCQFSAVGDYIKLTHGGSVNVIGGNAQLLAGGGKMFNIPSASGTHFSGVARILCQGMRVELRDEDSMLIDALDWKGGSIIFDSIDTTAGSHAYSDPDTVTARFYGQGDAGPNVQFRGCQLVGQHEYQYASSDWQAPPAAAVYDSCFIQGHTDLQDFIVNTQVGGSGRDGVALAGRLPQLNTAYTFGTQRRDHRTEVAVNWHMRRGGRCSAMLVVQTRGRQGSGRLAGRSRCGCR